MLLSVPQVASDRVGSRRTCEWCGKVTRKGRMVCYRCEQAASGRPADLPLVCGDCAVPLPVPKRGPLPKRCQRCRNKAAGQVDHVCPTCGVVFRAKRRVTYCSVGCAHRGKVRAEWKKALPRARCVGCGIEFTPLRASQKFHDRACADRVTARGGEKAIDLAEVAARDGYACGLCGKPVDMALSRMAKMGASIDHVVPLNPRPGEPRGDHDMCNAHLAHRGCNNHKGNMPPDPDLVSRVAARQAAWAARKV